MKEKVSAKIATLALGAWALSQNVGCAVGSPENWEAEEAAFGTVTAALSTSATYTIKGVHSGKCLDIAGSGTNDGDNVQIWTCSGATNQQFKFEDMGGGYYRVRNVNSNKCLDVWQWSTAAGGDIRQYSCTDGYNQQFSVSESNGVATFYNHHSGKMVDIWGWGTSNGTNVAQWDGTGGANQQFYLTQVSSGSSSGGSSSSSGGSTSTTNSTGATCSNPQGTNSVMAAIAAAMAKEMGRWEPMTDLEVNSSNWWLQVSAAGRARCSDGECANTAALLAMQDPRASEVVFPGGEHLDPGTLQSRLAAAYNAQAVCESRPDNGRGDDCPAEDHQLTLSSTSAGSCDTVFAFQAKSSNGWSNLTAPDQLKNKLLFAGYPNNPYLDFQSAGDWVSIDPTYGLTEDGTTSSGSCISACTKCSYRDLRGKCCVCNGRYGNFQRSRWSYRTYLCK